MSYYGKDKLYQLSHPNVQSAKNSSHFFTSIMMCLVSALIGGLVSVGIVPSLYVKKRCIIEKRPKY